MRNLPFVLLATACAPHGVVYEPAAAGKHRVQPEVCDLEPVALDQCTSGVVALVDGQAFTSLEQAASAGSDVVVCPGAHPTRLNTGDLTLRSASGSPEDTTLLGTGSPLLQSSGHLSVRALTLRGGESTYEGGAMTAESADVECSVFEDNHAEYAGGAISVSEGLQVTGSRFTHNTAGYAGGAIEARGDVLIEGSEFAENTAEYEGGAIDWGDWESSHIEISDSLFQQNRADYSGGAIELGTWAEEDQVAILHTDFEANSAPGDRGIVTFGGWGGFHAEVIGTQFRNTDTAITLGGWLESGFSMNVQDTSFEGERGDW